MSSNPSHQQLVASSYPQSHKPNQTSRSWTSTRHQTSTMTTSQVNASSKNLQALIFGASGITGWAITNAALSYPSRTTFERIVGLTSRPLSLKDSGFPEDSRLQLYAGLDLSQDSESIVRYLRSVGNIEDITHVYFAGKLWWN